jgi:hypothetical protein
VAHAQLGDARAGLVGEGDELGAHHGAVRGERQRPHELAAHELEGAVDVAQRHVEDAADEHVPRGRVERAVRRVGAVQAVAGDDVRRRRQRDEARELRQVELQVGVGQEDPLQAGGRQAGAHGRAVAAVAVVDQHAHPRVGGGAGVGQRARVVGAAVVDDDDLVRVGNKLARRRRLVDGALDVLGLVVAGEDQRQAAQAPHDVGSFLGGGDGGGTSHGREDRARS